MNKNTLYEVRKLLWSIQTELNHVKESLDRLFSEDELSILAYEAALGITGTQIELLSPEEIKAYAAECREYLQLQREMEVELEEELAQAAETVPVPAEDTLREKEQARGAVQRSSKDLGTMLP